MIRLFVALPLPEDVRDRLAGLGGGVPGARWLEPDSLHLTLRFIGDVEEGMARDLDTELARVAAPGFALTLAGVGQFGSGRKAHALWAGIERSEGLAHLQAKIESAVVRAGFPPETRKFTPHVTLARLNHANPDRLARFLSGNGLFRARPVWVANFALFQSLQGRGGAVYRALAEYPLDHDGWDEGERA